MRKNNVELVKCKNCFHNFMRMKTPLGSRARYGLPERVKSVNCVTCSQKCSREYNRGRPSYAQRLKLKC